MTKREYNKSTENNNNKVLFTFLTLFEALLLFITLISITQIIPLGVLAQVPISSFRSEVEHINNGASGNNTSTILLNDRNNNNLILNQQLSPNLSQLFEKVQGSVVQVSSSIPLSRSMSDTDNNGNGLFGSTLGSGFIYDNSGHIVTNYHVITGGAVPTVDAKNGNNTEEIQVTFQDGIISDATVVGTDAYSDLAVLKLTGDIPKGKLIPLPVGSSSGLKIGDSVYAIGNPFGLLGTVTEGIISGLNRQLPVDVSAQLQQQQQQQPPFLGQNIPSFSIPNMIQTDAAMNPGNSGGPLLNVRGEAIGVNIAIFSATGANSGVGLTIPSDAVKKIVPSLISTGTYQHPYVGIAGVDILPRIADFIGLEEAGGFLITEVTEGGPAAKAGLRGGHIPTNVDGRMIDLGGDVILAVDNKTISKIDDLTSYIESEKDVGDVIILKVIRDGNIEEIDLTLTARPELETIVQNISANQKQQQGQEQSQQQQLPNTPDDILNDLYKSCIQTIGNQICDPLFRKK
jgi:serine protease Do